MTSSGRRRAPREPVERRTDRRIERTRRELHNALGALIRAKGYQRITISEILARANVGRSTFYTHFRDKDDLLVSHIGEMLRALQPTERSAAATPPDRIVAFSLPFFEHIQHHRHMGAPSMGERGRSVLHEHLRRVLSERVSQDLHRGESTPRRRTGAISPELLAQHIASTFVLVLHWWTDDGNTASAAEADRVFRALVLPAIRAARPA